MLVTQTNITNTIHVFDWYWLLTIFLYPFWKFGIDFGFVGNKKNSFNETTVIDMNISIIIYHLFNYLKVAMQMRNVTNYGETKQWVYISLQQKVLHQLSLQCWLIGLSIVIAHCFIVSIESHSKSHFLHWD